MFHQKAPSNNHLHLKSDCLYPRWESNPLLVSKLHPDRLLSRDSYSTSKSYPPDMDQDHGFSDDGQSIKLGLGQVRLVRVLNDYRFYLLVTGDEIPKY